MSPPKIQIDDPAYGAGTSVFLVTDGGGDSREVLRRRRLVHRGCDVVEAADGRSAIDKLRAGRIDHIMPA